MTEVMVPWLPSAKYFKVLCRLGVNHPDTADDADSYPNLKTQGGTVEISASIEKFRYTEADGRSRIVYIPPQDRYMIQASTGELFDADGNFHVYLLDTTSPGVDPQGFTYKATIRPAIGAPTTVNIPGSPAGEVFDIATAVPVSASEGSSTLVSRVSVLEEQIKDAVTYPVQQVTVTGNLAYTLPNDAPADQVISVVFTQTTGGHTVTYGGSPVTVDTTAGAVTTVELHPTGSGFVVRYPVPGGTYAAATHTHSDYTLTGRASTQRLMAKLKLETASASILVISDSTAAGSAGKWPYLLAELLAADWPTWTVDFYVWNSTSVAYNAAITVQTGTNGKTLSIYNASVAGYGTNSWQGPAANTALYATRHDLVMVALGHNEQNLAADAWWGRYLGLVETISWTLPESEIVVVLQNPATANTYQQSRALLYREIASARGYGVIDVLQAFIDTGDAPGLTADGIHPTLAGQTLWADTCHSAFTYQPGAIRSAQTPSPLALPATNLLSNGDLTSLSGGLPVNWKLTNVTVVADTTNYESATVGRTNGAAGVGTALKFTSTGTSGRLEQWIPISRVKGRWVTLAVRAYAYNDSLMTVRPFIVDSSGTTNNTHVMCRSGAFGWTVVSRYIAPTATTANIVIYIGELGSAATIDRVVMTPGKFPRGEIA